MPPLAPSLAPLVVPEYAARDPGLTGTGLETPANRPVQASRGPLAVAALTVETANIRAAIPLGA